MLDAYVERKAAAVQGMKAVGIKPPAQGYKRAWVKCTECGIVAYYEYVPYTLSNPIRTMPCHHDFYSQTRTATEEEVIEFFEGKAGRA